jgi:deoxycytidine triphosphate deaminase
MIHIASDKTQSLYDSLREEDIQPNAIDLRVDKVFRIIASREFILEEDSKQHHETIPEPLNRQGYYDLNDGHYEIIMEGKVKIADGEAGFILPRSTLNRNGVFMTTGLYDSGYHGVMASVMHVNCGTFKFKPGTRVGQFLLFKAEALHQYDGDYGVTKKHDDKYHHLQEGWD